MRNKIFISLLIVSIFAAFASFAFKQEVSADETANGYHVEEVISDKFNKGTLDSSWNLLNGAEVNHSYNALHCISPVSYGTGPIINATTLSEKTVINFTINPISGRNESNISFNIGMASPNTLQKEPDVDCRIQLWDYQVVFLVYQDNLGVPSGDLNKVVLRDFGGLYSDLIPTDISIYIERKNPLLTELYVEYRRNGEIVNSTEYCKFQLVNPRYSDGYCGFFWDCVEMDLTDFKVYNDGVLTYQDDFTTNTLTYPGSDYTKGKMHINDTLNESNVYISNVSSILMDSANEAIKNAFKLTRQSNVTNPYELKYAIRINELNENSFVGFGFGMGENDNKIDAVNAIGLLKYDDNSAEVVAIKNGVVDRSNRYQISIPKLALGKYIDCSVTLDSSNNAYLTIAGVSFKFSNINFYGQTGVGLVDLGATNSSSFDMNQISLSRNVYNEYPSIDISNDFTGRKANGEDEWDSLPYINSQKYFVGRGVSLEEDWATGTTEMTFSNAGPYSGFGYRAQYSEFVCEFDVNIYSRQKNQMIGLSFGKQSIVDVLIQASKSNKAFLLVCGQDDAGKTHTDQSLYGDGMKFDDGSSYRNTSVNVFDENETEWHMMFVAKNRTLYVYYAPVDADASELSICRAVIHDINIDGFVTVVGNNGVNFGLSNFKIVNLSDACTTDSSIAIRESFDTAESVSSDIVLGDSKVVDGKLSMNNTTINTKDEFLYEIIRFTPYQLTDSLQIRLSKGKKILFDIEKNQIVITEGANKTAYDCSSMNFEFIKNKRFEITVFGNEITIGYKGYYDPLDKLSTTVVSHTLETALEKDQITFSANGKVVLDDIYIFSLDNKYKAETLNYNDDPDNLDIWTIKPDFDPSKVYGAEAQGCGSSIGVTFVVLPLLGIFGAALLLKKKENDNE